MNGRVHWAWLALALALLTEGKSGAAPFLRVDDILVADASSPRANPFGTILRIDPDTGSRSVISTGGLFQQPVGVTLDLAGNVYVADLSFGGVIRVELGTGRQTALATSLGGLFVNPTGITVLPDGSRLFVADPDADPDPSQLRGAIIELNLLTGARRVVSSDQNFVNPVGVVADPAGTALYVTDIGELRGVDGRVFKVDPGTGVQTLLAGGLVNPVGIALAPDGNLFVADAGEIRLGPFDAPGTPGSLLRIDPSGNVEVLLTGLPFVDPTGVGVNSRGQLIVVDANAFGEGAIFRVTRDPVSGAWQQSVITRGGDFVSAVGIVLVAQDVEVAGIPEPASLGLWAAAGAVLVAWRRFARRPGRVT